MLAPGLGGPPILARAGNIYDLRHTKLECLSLNWAGGGPPGKEGKRITGCVASPREFA